MFRMQRQIPGSQSVRHQRWKLVSGVLIGLPVALLIWYGVYGLVPPIANLEEPGARLAFAVKCCCVAVLLCFQTGIESLAYKRLNPNALDTIAGQEERRVKVDLRYLQHTLEQLLLFVPGVLGLATYCADGDEMRAVLAATLVWIVSRVVFWVGYHRGARFRGAGLLGMVQSAILLLYVSARFGHELAGPIGAAIPLALAFGAETYFIVRSRR